MVLQEMHAIRYKCRKSLLRLVLTHEHQTNSQIKLRHSEKLPIGFTTNSKRQATTWSRKYGKMSAENHASALNKEYSITQRCKKA